MFIECGGDNLAATFSPELADLTIYVIDVAAGDKIPRKGGPGITRSDLLVINKIDLAPLVGADLGVMERDARRMRGERPFVFTNIRSGEGVAAVADFITTMGGLAAPAPVNPAAHGRGYRHRAGTRVLLAMVAQHTLGQAARLLRAAPARSRPRGEVPGARLPRFRRGPRIRSGLG